MTIRVTPIQTGWARMKAAQRCGREGRSAFGRKLDIIRDKTWIDRLPILAWLIEHPEGRFLVDTGDTAENSTPGYLPWWNPFFTKMVQIKVAPIEEVGFRLQAMGLDPDQDIEAVILTHYHHDHTGGLHHFPYNRIIGPRDGWSLARSFMGKMMGCLPQRWPIWLKPELVDLDGPPVGPFPSSHPITKDGRIFLVPTPGHFRGHVAVVARGEAELPHGRRVRALSDGQHLAAYPEVDGRSHGRQDLHHRLRKGNSMRKLIPLLAGVLIGCGNVAQNPEPVEVTGRVTLRGKPVSDVTFNLQPTGAGAQAAFPVKAGAFHGKVTPGRYTFYISEGRNAASFRAIPEQYRSGSLDRQINVGEGTTLSITLD